jgi:outer membrane protein assembly factor BamD
MAKDRLNAFLAHYPKSKYRAEATQAMHAAEDLLAKSDLEVAKYNLRHKAYLGAIMRAEKVVKLYPHSESAKKAYAIIDQGYTKLNLKSEHAELQQKLKSLNKAHT